MPWRRVIGAGGDSHRTVVALLQSHGHGQAGGDPVGGDDDRGPEVGFGSHTAASVVGSGGVDAADPSVVADVRGHGANLLEEPGPAALSVASKSFVHAHPRAGDPVVRSAVDLGPVEFEPVTAADEAQPLVPVPAVGFRQLHTEVAGLLDCARGQGIAADLVARES